MSIYPDTSSTEPVILEEDGAPPHGARVLAGFDIALTVLILAVIGLGAVTRDAAQGMPINDYTDYRGFGGWIGFNATLHPILPIMAALGIPVTIFLVVGSLVALTGVRSAPGTFRALLAGTIALVLATIVLLILGSRGALLFISNLD